MSADENVNKSANSYYRAEQSYSTTDPLHCSHRFSDDEIDFAFCIDNITDKETDESCNIFII